MVTACVTAKGRPRVGKRRSFLPRDVGGGCVLWCEADYGITLGNTPLASGTAPPAVTLSGTLTQNTGIYIQCDTAGTVGVTSPTFKWSTDGGSTFVQTLVAMSSSGVALGSTGITATFPASVAYLTNNIWQATVTTWADHSGSGNDLSQQANATSWIYNPGQINGRAALKLGAITNSYMTSPSLTLGPMSVLVVHKFSGTAGYVWVHKANATDGAYVYGDVGSSTKFIRTSALSQGDVSANWAPTGATISSLAVFDGTHAGHAFYLSGVAQTLSSFSGAVNDTTTRSGALFVGTTQGGAAPSTGHVVMVAVWPRALGQQEATRLANYTKSKYGA